MKEVLLKKGKNVQDTPKANSGYQRYQELGGIINEKDYENVLIRAGHTTKLEETLMKQVELIAHIAGIELQNQKDVIDQRILLYGILRTDTKPKEVQYHHSQMCDQRLFAEALRILGDIDSLNKLIAAFPQIIFH